ncbi:MAG: tRNA 2-thiouridine(34) synthase MnmA [Nevskiaceae bacterium]|nr:MAG: tRNA 2-thiouridine(34) synthase MnmA [Nevskiaceae bacterium]TAM31687.1 MAG: tRNA 2-thiouridine(34) synthase MnmA [Nevskiaceae bacterium]
MSRQVFVGLSGGVDSAVSAWLLKEQGYRVSGLFMQNWAEDESGYCTAAEDYQAARAVAEELGIPLHRVDFSAEYRERVFAAFLRQLREGKTPNPDVLCNREIKFQPFVEHARRLGAELVATGHYAALESSPEGPVLLRAADENKDQTYFLAGVPRQQFENVLFPLGGLNKPEVRALAARAGLPNHRRKDSTGICFIGERPFAEFLAEHLPPDSGPIETDQGEVLGEHRGLQFFTLGQRKGVGIGGRRGASEAPWYVVDKDLARKALIVSQQAEHPRLFRRELRTERFHWLGRVHPEEPLHARLRHRQPLAACQVRETADAGLEVLFEQPQRAITPGQYLVLYQGHRCLGCGEIAATATF